MPRPIVTRVFILAVLFSFSAQSIFLCRDAHAQEPAGAPVFTTENGINLYNQGKLNEAINLLQVVVRKNEGDPDAWYYLGLAYYKSGLFGSSRTPFERFLELQPNFADANAKLSRALIFANDPMRAKAAARRAIDFGDLSAEPHYALAEASFRSGDMKAAIEEADRTLGIDSGFSAALLTRSMAHFQLKQNAEAADDLEQLLALNPEDPDAAAWRTQIEGLRSSIAAGDSLRIVADTNATFTTKQVEVKARIIAKPEPQYSETARRAGATGTVVMQCVFGSDGEVRDILVRKALGYGLTTQAINAAKKIKFTPAQKDGRAVSTYMMLEYNFNLY
jgi:TonB family protein